MADVVLCIGGGLLQTYAIHEAHALGFDVMVVDRDESAPGFAMAQYAEVIDTYDGEGVLTYARECVSNGVPLVGVLTCGADVAPTVARVAAALGLPGVDRQAAMRTHNKYHVRMALLDTLFNDYQPRFAAVSTLEDALLQTSLGDVGFPCVVKPLEERASRGVTMVRDAAALPEALAQASTYGGFPVLLEACLTGTEHSVEFLFGPPLGGGFLPNTLWFNVVDRFFSYEWGHPIERGHCNPSALSSPQMATLKYMGTSIALALGVTWGPFKMDVLWTSAGPKLLECTARLSGGFDAQETSPATRRHPLRQLVQLATGLPVEPQDRGKGFAACAAILPQSPCRPAHLPTVADVGGGEHPHLYPPASRCVRKILWTIHPGDVCGGPLAHNAQRPGYVITTGESSATAWDLAAQVAERVATMLVAGSPLVPSVVPRGLPQSPDEVTLSSSGTP